MFSDVHDEFPSFRPRKAIIGRSSLIQIPKFRREILRKSLVEKDPP